MTAGDFLVQMPITHAQLDLHPERTWGGGAISSITESRAYGVPMRPCFPRVLHPPMPIFTTTDPYYIQLGPELGDDPNNDVEASVVSHN